MSEQRSIPKVHVTDPNFSFVFETPNLNVEIYGDGRVVVHKGTVEQTTISAKAAFAKALKTGDVIPDGPNKGWIYCEGDDIEPFLVAPKDSGVMKWREAMEFAAREKMELPTEEQLNAMYAARDTGALKGTFNITGYDPIGWYWAAPQSHCLERFASSKSFADGFFIEGFPKLNHAESSLRCVRPFKPT